MEFGQRVSVKVVHILFFQRGAQSDGARNVATFLRNRAGPQILDGKERADLILKLSVEKTRLIRAKIVFSDIHSRTRYRQDDQHHRQQ